MGVVYRALDPVLNRHVAIKLMGNSLASDSQLRDRFMREAQAAGSLQHPNIITIFDFGEADGHLYIAMEYVEGSDLSEIMERADPLTLPAKLDIMIDVLHALQYAHARRVVHRDIKPANIRVGTDGRAKLMDFGIARLESSELTKTGMLIGTPNYMAPEQVNGGQVSPATDIFSLGAVLYEFLSGQKSFGGDTLHAVLYKVVAEQPPPLQTMLPGCPRDLQRIVDKSLAKEPAERYEHAGLMAQDLSVVRTALSGGGGVTISARRTPLANSVVRGDATLSSSARSAQVTVTRLPVVIGGGMLAIAAAALLFLFGRREAPLPPAAPATVAAVSPPAAAVPETVRITTPATPAPEPQRVARTPATRPETVIIRSPAPAQSSPPATPLQNPAPSQAPPVQQTQQTQQAPPPAPANVTSTPAPAVQAPPATPPQPADPRPEIEQLLASYARAIESRSIAEIRRVYPGMTANQQQGWEQFFPSVRNLRARLAIARLDVNDNSADFSVTGTYEYEGGSGRTERQPASFRAIAVLEGGVWRLRSVR